MIPAKQRRIIIETFDTYGSDIALISDDTLPADTFFVVDDGVSTPAAHGSVRYINHARAIRDNIYVPECYDEDAQTWA